MPIKARIFDGDVVIETRSNSRKLQARWKSAVQGRHYERVSLNTDQLEEAKVIAKKAYEEYRAYVITGTPLKSERTIKFVANEYLQQFGDRSGLSTQAKQYLSAIENYIIPILGSKRITEINKSIIDQFNKARDAKMKSFAKKGTVSKHHTALKKIYEFAVEKKYCTVNDIPNLSVRNIGVKGEARPAFTDEELKLIWVKFDEWIEISDRSDISYRRKILKLYCYFLYKIGCRPGVEINELQWKCLDDGQYPLISLFIHKSKYEDKKRNIYIPYEMLKILHDIGQLTKHTKPSDYIFCNPTGQKLVDLSRTFKSFLVYADLLEAKSGKHIGQERTLYSFRHSFATQKVKEMTIGEIADMADYMGTSPEMIVRFYVESNANQFARKFVIGSENDAFTPFYESNRKSDNAGYEIAKLYSGNFDNNLKTDT